MQLDTLTIDNQSNQTKDTNDTVVQNFDDISINKLFKKYNNMSSIIIVTILKMNDVFTISELLKFAKKSRFLSTLTKKQIQVIEVALFENFGIKLDRHATFVEKLGSLYEK